MRIAIRALFFCLALACSSAHGSRTEVHAGLALLDFDYKEYSESGVLLDRESGLLPGFLIELAQTAGGWRLSGTWRLFSGTADHDGRTNLGTPIRTATDERIDSLSLQLARELDLGGWLIAPYAGYAYHRWERDIQPTQTASGAPVNGLFEVYSWNTAELGVLARLAPWGRFEGAVDVRVFRILDPEVKVRFSTGFDDARLALGEKSGGRLAFIGAYPLDDRLRLRVEVYGERWSFGRSAPQPLTSGGATVGSVTEPRSETRNHGMTLGLVLGF